MKTIINEDTFNRWQKLAGIINESQLNEEETPDQAVQKAMSYSSEIENSPALDKAAEKIANDPALLAQLQKALSQGGVQADLNEAAEELDSTDMKTLMINFAKKSDQLNEDGLSNDPEKDTASSGLSMLSFFGGGALGQVLSGIITAVIPAATSVVAGPALVGAVGGLALFLIARKIYLMNNPDK
jgi:hypothetical protein